MKRTGLEVEAQEVDELKAELILVDGTTYDAEIMRDNGLNTEQKFLSRIQNDGGLWVEEADDKLFIPYHAILKVCFKA